MDCIHSLVRYYVSTKYRGVGMLFIYLTWYVGTFCTSHCSANQVSRTQDVDTSCQAQLYTIRSPSGDWNQWQGQTKEGTIITIKIHQQFGNATADKLQKLLVDSGVRDSELSEMLRQVVNNCESCALYKKTPPKPAVGLPLATEQQRHH